LATGLRALNAVPAVNALPSGWVTALDLPLIPGLGTVR
jgi:4-hydroxy-tetrahydrodipicolinate reductase